MGTGYMTEEARPRYEEGRSERQIRRKKRMLLGLGLDCTDGEKRITVGKNFHLYGGSKQTHEQMQEKAVKLNEHLDERGKTLDEVARKELDEIAEEIGLVRLPPRDE